MPYRPSDLSAALGNHFAGFQALGSGGDGAVFSAYDRARKEDVAVKISRDTGEPGLAERFEREYQILAVTRSDRLVRVHNHGRQMIRDDTGFVSPHFWFSMEKCDSSVRRTFKQMALADRLSVVLQMLDGLALLHAKNIAHRDIKPDNLFLVSAARGLSVKIGDFGIATNTRFAPNMDNNMIHGSPKYLAPERWTSSGDGDWRPADQYAAGITMFEILSVGGEALDYSNGAIVAHQRSGVRPLMIPELRGRRVGEVDKVIGQMLSKRPDWRHTDVAECKRELEAAMLIDRLVG